MQAQDSDTKPAVQFNYDFWLVLGLVPLLLVALLFGLVPLVVLLVMFAGTYWAYWLELTQQEQLVLFTPEHWQRVKLKLKALVTRVSFLVQLQSQDHVLLTRLVTFLQEQFSFLSEGCKHVKFYTSGFVLLLLVPLLFGFVPLVVLLVLFTGTYWAYWLELTQQEQLV